MMHAGLISKFVEESAGKASIKSSAHLHTDTAKVRQLVQSHLYPADNNGGFRRSRPAYAIHKICCSSRACMACMVMECIVSR